MNMLITLNHSVFSSFNIIGYGFCERILYDSGILLSCCGNTRSCTKPQWIYIGWELRLRKPEYMYWSLDNDLCSLIIILKGSWCAQFAAIDMNEWCCFPFVKMRKALSRLHCMRTLSFFFYTLEEENVGRSDGIMYGFLNHQLCHLSLKKWNLFTVCIQQLVYTNCREP